MTSKELRKYALVAQIGNCDSLDPVLPELFRELAQNDFAVATDMWEYMLTTHAGSLGDMAISQNLEARVFETLTSSSEAKLRTMLGGNTAILRLIYGNSATSATGANLGFLTSLVLGSKIEAADEILKFITTNKSGDYGVRMQTIIDDVFESYCRKNHTKVPNLNRKQTMLLLEYALKIKGPNGKILVQRVKELQ